MNTEEYFGYWEQKDTDSSLDINGYESAGVMLYINEFDPKSNLLVAASGKRLTINDLCMNYNRYDQRKVDAASPYGIMVKRGDGVSKTEKPKDVAQEVKQENVQKELVQEQQENVQKLKQVNKHVGNIDYNPMQMIAKSIIDATNEDTSSVSIEAQLTLNFDVNRLRVVTNAAGVEHDDLAEVLRNEIEINTDEILSALISQIMNDGHSS